MMNLQISNRTMRELIKVAHSDIKAKLDAEKHAKEKRKALRGLPLRTVLAS